MRTEYKERFEDCEYWEVSLSGGNSLESVQSLVDNLMVLGGVDSVDTDDLLSGWCDYRIVINFSSVDEDAIEEVCEALCDIYYDSICDDMGNEVDPEDVLYGEDDDEEEGEEDE